MTGYVDGALEPAERAELEAHIAACPVCAEQVAQERALADQLRRLPAVAPRPEFELRLRTALRASRSASLPRRVLGWGAALAAGLTLFLVWGREAPPALARALSDDHVQCRPVESLESQADEVRSMPRQAAGLALVAAGRCRLPDGSLVVHLHYVEGARRVSVFLVDGVPRPAGSYQGRIDGNAVRLLPAKGRTLGVVGDPGEDLAAVERAIAGA